MFEKIRQLSPLKLFGMVALILIGFGALQSLASAQSNSDTTLPPEGEAILGTLTAFNEKEERIPIANVQINVFLGGDFVGDSISDENGVWRVPVPGAGTYRVRLDTGTLPEGLYLTDKNQEELSDVSVRTNQQKRIIFRLGESISAGISRIDRLSNLFIAGLRLGAIIAMAGVGLALIYSVTNLVNFAHGELITMGALMAYLFNTSPAGPGWHLLIAIVPSMIVVGLLSASMEISLWAPLRKSGTSELTMMIISIGLSLVFRYIYLILFAGQTRSYLDYAIQDSISFLSFTTTPKTLWILGVSILILLAISAMLLITKHGTSIRALADNSDLAKASGINVDQTILIAWLLGAATTALSGIFLGMTQGVDWDMGWQFLLIVFAGVILGGSGSVFGAMVGGFVVGMFLEISTYWIETEFKIAMALGVISVILVWRPQGILGWRMRTA